MANQPTSDILSGALNQPSIPVTPLAPIVTPEVNILKPQVKKPIDDSKYRESANPSLTIKAELVKKLTLDAWNSLNEYIRTNGSETLRNTQNFLFQYHENITTPNLSPKKHVGELLGLNKTIINILTGPDNEYLLAWYYLLRFAYYNQNTSFNRSLLFAHPNVYTSDRTQTEAMWQLFNLITTTAEPNSYKKVTSILVLINNRLHNERVKHRLSVIYGAQ